MRTSGFNFRLELSEAEHRDLAERAFEAGASLHDYLHRLLTERPKPQQEIVPPAWPVLRTRISLRPLAVSSDETPAPLLQQHQVVVAAAPEPAPPEPEALPLAPEKRTRAPNSVPDPTKMPLGWDRIIDVAPKVAEARRRTIEEAGANKGIVYNRLIKLWYERNGLGETDNNNRSALAQIGENLPAILTWHASLPAGVLREDTTPVLLLRWWQEGRTVPSMRGRKAAPAPAPQQPMVELRRGHVASAGELMPVFDSKGKITYVEADELFRSAATRPAEPEPEPTGPKTGPKFDSFNLVDFGALNPFDLRVLRRFHERMLDLGVDKRPDLTPRDIALAIRKIRGNESGDNTPTAAALVRLGILAGTSGDYRFRKEYLSRFGEVTRWTLGFQTKASVPAETDAVAPAK